MQVQQQHELKPITTDQLCLVSTKNLEREKWLNIHKQGIGSSDAAAAVD